jgi:hypothetical protein
VQYNHKCQVCHADNWLAAHLVEQGSKTAASVLCVQCGTEYKLRRYIVFERVDTPTPNEAEQTVTPVA